MSGLPWLAQPRVVALICIMLMLLGVSAYVGMPRQEDPNFPYRAGQISVSYPGALAEAVERLVLQPLADELAQVEEIDDFTGTARTGVAITVISLKDRIYDTDAAWERVRQAIARAQREFPEGVAEPVLDDRRIDTSTVVLALRGDPSPVALSLAAERLRRALLDLPGLSRIELQGDAEEQITIALRDAQLLRLGLSPQRVQSVLAERNQLLPGGFAVVDGRRLGLLPNTEFQSVESLLNTQIPLADGGSVPLSAVAEVWRGPREPEQPAAWYDGERAVLLNLVMARTGVDAIRFGAALRTRIEALQPEFAPLQIEEMFFQPDQVAARLHSLERSLIGSVLIIVAVVLLGMGWRMGVLVAATLPVVALISLGLYSAGGGILHQIAVIGVVISLGILVDNGIVMVEAIQHALNEGVARERAMRESVRSLLGPLGASTATTLAAFTPLLLSKGGTGDFTRGIPIMIMLTLSISYLLTMTAVPLLAARFLRPARAPALTGRRWRSLSVQGLADRLAVLGTQHSLYMILFGMLMVGLSAAMAPWLKLQFFPNADRPQVVVDLFLPEGTDQQYTLERARELERWLRTRTDVQQVHRFVGDTGPAFYYNLQRASAAPSRARLVVNTQSLAQTGPLLRALRAHVGARLPELQVVASTLGQGPPRVAPVEVRLFHADDRARLAAAEQVFAALKTVPGAVDVRHDIDLGVPVMRVDVDDALAQRANLGRAQAAQALFAQTLGTELTQYRQTIDPIPVVLRSPEGTLQSLERVLSVSVFNAADEAVPLAAISRWQPQWMPASILQRNGVRLYSVTAGLDEGASYNQVQDALLARLRQAPLPPGTRLEFGGDAESSGDANQALASSAPLGLLLLLLFLLLQFNSYRRMAIILLTVPLASAGVIPGLVLSQSPFGFQSLLGVIALVGIVVNNAIVLLDAVDQRLAEGMDIRAAVAGAVQRRTRPIVLTTATTVAGLLPLAFSASTLWPPMAWAIISGLLASTVLSLLVVPAVACHALAGSPIAARAV